MVYAKGFFPGLSEAEYEGFRKAIRYDPSIVHIITESFKRIESTRCKRWFAIARNAPIEEKSADVVKCTGCKKLVHDLERSQKRASTTSPRRKQKRRLPSSHFIYTLERIYSHSYSLILSLSTTTGYRYIPSSLMYPHVFCTLSLSFSPPHPPTHTHS